MRNGFISGTRRSWLMIDIDDEDLGDLLLSEPSQEAAVSLKDVQKEIGRAHV